MAAGRIQVVDRAQRGKSFALISTENRLLLFGALVSAERIANEIDEFQRHCGLVQFYRACMHLDGRWYLELVSYQGRSLARSQYLDDEAEIESLRDLAISQGPFAGIADAGQLTAFASGAVCR